MPHPKTDFNKDQIASRWIIPWPKYTKTYFFEAWLAFRRFRVKEPSHSENVLAKMWYVYRRTRPRPVLVIGFYQQDRMGRKTRGEKRSGRVCACTVDRSRSSQNLKISSMRRKLKIEQKSSAELETVFIFWGFFRISTCQPEITHNCSNGVPPHSTESALNIPHSLYCRSV